MILFVAGTHYCTIFPGIAEINLAAIRRIDAFDGKGKMKGSGIEDNHHVVVKPIDGPVSPLVHGEGNPLPFRRQLPAGLADGLSDLVQHIHGIVAAHEAGHGHLRDPPFQLVP